MSGLNIPKNSNVLVGLEKPDDAGVYRISDNIALIQTVDFFTPMVDDPFHFGRIAAANALSDVYAMGGEPKTAMNLVAFPRKNFDISVLRAIIDGAIDALNEADTSLIGGHSIDDKEIKFGLSITGFVHPDRVLTKTGARVGDAIILTKPIGTGIISTAIKAGTATEKEITDAIAVMSSLNRKAVTAMSDFNIHACTDITGFGLLGHMAEMVYKSYDIAMYIDHNLVPLIDGTMERAASGFVPGGAKRNFDFRKNMVHFEDHIPPETKDILFDPQTSGGLLICIAGNEAEQLITAMKNNGIEGASVIGEVINKPAGKLLVG